jgi:hypothetical protein
MADKTIAQLDVVATGSVTNTAVFETQVVGLAAPESRQLTLPQMQALINIAAAKILIQQSPAKVGATAGWVVGAANNQGKLATLPAAQTASTLVIPVTGVRVGDTITGFALEGSLQSVGAAVSITGELRMLTANAAGAVDSSVGVMAAALSVVANTIVSSLNAAKVGLAQVVAEGQSFYLLITATTAAVTTAEVQAVQLNVTQAP